MRSRAGSSYAHSRSARRFNGGAAFQSATAPIAVPGPAPASIANAPPPLRLGPPQRPAIAGVPPQLGLSVVVTFPT
jgi:hypothetical protein